jgi:LysM repeat protein
MGVFLALISSLVVLGSMALSLAESGRPITLIPPTETLKTDEGDLAGFIRLVPAKPAEPAARATPQEVVPTAFPTLDCPVVENWVAHTVQNEGNLMEVTQNLGMKPEDVRAGNCLTSNQLAAGQVIYLPPTSTSSAQTSPSELAPTQRPNQKKPKKTQIACGAPRGWVAYTVRRGDTLISLAARLGVTVPQLRSANCMGGSSFLRAGQQLFVPYIPAPLATRTPVRQPPTNPPPTLTPVPPPTQPPPTQPPPVPTDPVAPPPPTKEPLPTQPPPPPDATPTPGLGELSMPSSTNPI